MKFLAFTALALLLLSVESVVVRFFGFEVTRIDVTLALVVYVAVRSTTLEGAFTAFAIGYLVDAFTPRPTWLYPFLAVLTFLLVRGAAQLLDTRSKSSFALFVAAATLGHGLLVLFFTWLTSTDSTGLGRSLTGLPLQVLLTAALGVLLLPALRRIESGERVEPGLLR